MRWRLLTWMVASLMLPFAASADECRIEAFKTTKVEDTDYKYQLATYLSLTREEFQEMSNSGSVEASFSLLGFFDASGGGDWNSFKSRRSRIVRENRLNLSQSLLRNYRINHLDAYGVEAYRICRLSQSGLYVIVQPGATDHFVSVRIYWKAPAGLEPEPEDGDEIQLEFNGADLQPRAINIRRNGSYPLTIPRTEGNWLTIDARNRFGFADQVQIPKSELIPEVEVVVDPPLPKEIGSCVGYGGVNGVRFWGPPSAHCNAISGWGHYNQTLTEVGKSIRLCKCIGYGGVQGVHLWGPEGEACGGIPGWGTYSSSCVDMTETRLCSCRGRGDILNQMNLWGPEGHVCGGIWRDEDYSQACI